MSASYGMGPAELADRWQFARGFSVEAASLAVAWTRFVPEGSGRQTLVLAQWRLNGWCR